jgi:hypothetical protein
MTLKNSPKNPPGSYPGQGMMDTMGSLGLRVGIITRIDELNMKADVKVLTGGGDRYEIDLTQSLAGPRSFWGGVPEVGSLVIIGYRPKHKQLTEAMILGYLPVGNKTALRFDPFAPADPSTIDPADAALYKQTIGSTIRYKRLKLRPGDVGGMSADGSEFTLAKDVRITNRAGDLIELRDSDRTLVTQAVHSFSSVSGVKTLAGPVRRGSLYLPNDIFKLNADGTRSKTLLTEADNYYGRDNLQAAGPGAAGSPTKFANTSGVVLDVFNDTTNFPPVTYTNGKKAYYAATVQAVNFEDGEVAGGAEVFTEHRLEMAHQTDATQDVLAEIDGFDMNHPKAYIEQAFGTIIGNDTTSTTGIRQYGRVLKPHIFDDWGQVTPGKFKLEEIQRSPTEEDISSITEAGAYLFRVYCPTGNDEDNPFACAVSKQGKLFLHAPGSSVERYPKEKNISAEVNLEGALKMFCGTETSSRTSIKLTTEGSIEADIGRNAVGESINITVHGTIVTTYDGSNGEHDVVKSDNVGGNCELFVRGDYVSSVAGSKHTIVNGMLAQNVDRMNVNAHSGMSVNAGGYDSMISGKSQYNYALAVLENIFLGGKVSTILAGGSVQNVLAGVYTISAAAGAVSVAAGAGAVAVTAGAALTLTAGAALSASAGGAVSVQAALALSMTAGLAVTITAAVACSLVAPQVLVGGPPAVLGIARGLPVMPPGTPSLDYITGLPLMGAAMAKSI